MGHLLYAPGHAGSELQRRVVTAYNPKLVMLLLRRLSCASLCICIKSLTAGIY